MPRVDFFLLWHVVVLWACNSPSTSPPSSPIRSATQVTKVVVINALQVQQAGIKWDTLPWRHIGMVVTASGTLEVPPSEHISITAIMGGVVKQTNLLPGMLVKKGEVLAIMEHPEYVRLQQSYLEARNQMIYAEKELRRQQELVAANATAQQKLEAAESSFNAAQIQVKSLASQLQMLGINIALLHQGEIQPQILIRSPVNGTVTQVYINTGKFVAANEAICQIISREHLHAVLHVFERDIMKVKVGQPVTLRIMGADKSYEGQIILVNRTFDNTTKTVEVHAHLKRDDANLKAGMFVEAQIHTQDHLHPVLPNDALFNENDQWYAFVLAAQSADSFAFEKVQVSRVAFEEGFSAIVVPPQWKGKPFVQSGVYYLLSLLKKAEEE
ncbi:MAG: efflux RND transporter periplasmic adaptor subunit [Cytophagales bacterium]|nr:efflux RND transporter periplasmic adaptor subunit [Bernardetiaceae bacterium]MDW8209797.1 efflux RND transporter periplasmic adaptor subunit [Cytophagales bacterium]